MNKEDVLSKEINSYFVYLGIYADCELDFFDVKDRTHIVQLFMDIVENEEYKRRGNTKHLPLYELKADVPEEYEDTLLRLIHFYEADKMTCRYVNDIMKIKSKKRDRNGK